MDMPTRLQTALVLCPTRVTPTKRRLAWSPDAGQRTESPWSSPEAERLAARRAGWRYYASPAPLDAKPPARPAVTVTPIPATPVVTPRRGRKTTRTKPDAARIKELERGWVHHGSRHAPIVDRPPQRSPRRWRKSPSSSVPDEDVAYDVEEEEYVKIPVALFKNLSKYFACAKPDFVESARPPDDEEERVIVG